MYEMFRSLLHVILDLLLKVGTQKPKDFKAHLKLRADRGESDVIQSEIKPLLLAERIPFGHRLHETFGALCLVLYMDNMQETSEGILESVKKLTVDMTYAGSAVGAFLLSSLVEEAGALGDIFGVVGNLGKKLRKSYASTGAARETCDHCKAEQGPDVKLPLQCLSCCSILFEVGDDSLDSKPILTELLREQTMPTCCMEIGTQGGVQAGGAGIAADDE
jgi:hypothetical protein